jgi:hypothetical protein
MQYLHENSDKKFPRGIESMNDGVLSFFKDIIRLDLEIEQSTTSPYSKAQFYLLVLETIFPNN